jgi:hypothetical protein
MPAGRLQGVSSVGAVKRYQIFGGPQQQLDCRDDSTDQGQDRPSSGVPNIPAKS